jgi:hypothetical protein
VFCFPRRGLHSINFGFSIFGFGLKRNIGEQSNRVGDKSSGPRFSPNNFAIDYPPVRRYSSHQKMGVWNFLFVASAPGCAKLGVF